MAEYRITYWREIPSMVTAREGEATAKSGLPARFQEAIDEAAMRLGETDSAAYLEGWTRGDWTPSDGGAAEVCDRVVAELEGQWPAERMTAYLDQLGPAPDEGSSS
jgi:hypothetical protein